MSSSWYLEHVTTRERIGLYRGENLMGRHSCCRITLSEIYECVSREHVKIIVSDAGVIVQDLNSRNGVFINETQMSGEFKRLPVVEGTIISLGVEGHIADVPRNYPIFVLRKVATEAEEIVLSSDEDDDDDTMPLPAQKTNGVNGPKEFNLAKMIPDLGAKMKNTTDQKEHPSCSNLHLPKMAKMYDGDVIELDTDADKEMQPPPPSEPLESVDEEYDEQFAMSQAVLQDMKAEMEFSDGEEDFLTSTNLQDEEPLGSPSSLINYDDIIIINESDDDELYDKVADWSSKLLSQKVPDAIEMSQAYPLIEDSGSDQESPSSFGIKQPPKSLRIDSSSEDESSDPVLCHADSTTNPPLLGHCPESIISIAGEVSSTETTDVVSSSAKQPKVAQKISPKDVEVSKSTSKYNERARVEKSSLSKPLTSKEYKKQTFDDNADVPKTLPKGRLRNRSKSCYIERPIDMNEILLTKHIPEKQGDKQRNERLEEVEDCREVLVVTLHAPEEPEKIPLKKSRSRPRLKSTHSREENEVKVKETQKNGKSVSPRKQGEDETAKVAESPVMSKSARLLNRSRSCYIERPIDMNEHEVTNKRAKEDGQEMHSETLSRKPHKSIKKGNHEAPANKSEGNKLKKTYEKIKGKATEPENDRKKVTPSKEDTVKAVTPVKKGPSPRLLNRSKSCVMDKPMHTDNPTRADPAEKARFTRGPFIIEAPFMPKNRGKIHNMDKQKVIDRQRLVDYKTEMNAKWHQKPKDKKKDDQVIKDKRREALKKLSDKPKDEENCPSSSNAKKRKNCTSVPTVSNTNRGEFLTKGIENGPHPKIPKMADKLKAPTPLAKNSIPKRRSTTDSFSQHLLAADEPAKYPQPLCSRPAERKEAQQARNQRTCNRVSFADLERSLQKAEGTKEIEKQRKHVRFCDKVDIKYIDKVCGASKPVHNSKDSLKICLSTRSERREWTLKGNNMVNDILYHKRIILTWANQWLKQGSVEAVAESDVLMPIPSDFIGFQQYRKTFLPLMKLELLTTIERNYKSSKTTLDLKVMDVYCEKECYRVVARTSVRPIGKFDLYTLSSGTELDETFASLLGQKFVGGTVCDMTFQVWVQEPVEKMKSLKHLTARPVVDSLRVDLGALSAIHQLHRSPLCRRILMPTEEVKTVQLPKVAQALAYKGFTKLNKHQEDICLSVYERVIDNVNPSVTLVQGPPGTGKSILMSNLSLQCLYGGASVVLDRKILICAHSNTAVDHMVKALSKAHSAMSRNHFQLLRFGLAERICQHSRPFSVEAHLKKARSDKLKRITQEDVEILKKQHCDLKAEIQQLKQKSNLTSTYLQHKLEEKEKQLLLIREQLNPSLTQREEHDIAKRCVNRAHIVCTTLSSCVKLANYVDFFDICIIDEATQCTEPWTLLPMRFGIKHLVLVGDTQQLPAVVLSKKAIEFGLGNSMFDRIQKSLVKHLDLDQAGGNHQFVHTKLFKLSMQYRMHPEICRWPNKYFYEDQLVNADLTAKSSPLIPYCVVNLSHTRDTSGTNGNRSISNEEEALFVAQLLAEMDKHMPSKRFSYGLISPYSNQCHALSRVIPPHMNLTPQTVDSYQGLEKDVIIISNARTRGCGFLSNYQRLNVALTRPRRCLIICGNFDDLQSVDLWRQLLDDARQRKVYFDLKRDDVTDLKRSLINKMLVKPVVIP